MGGGMSGNSTPNEWKHSLFGCFDNFGLCIVTFFAPCFTLGKNAESVGENCVLFGLSEIVGLGCCAQLYIRGKIREKHNIAGDLLGDVGIVFCCSPCALCQEGMEMEVMGQSMARE